MERWDVVVGVYDVLNWHYEEGAVTSNDNS